jgi:hypothetical protein
MVNQSGIHAKSSKFPGKLFVACALIGAMTSAGAMASGIVSTAQAKQSPIVWPDGQGDLDNLSNEALSLQGKVGPFEQAAKKAKPKPRRPKGRAS